jgi:hypothetical protein
VESRCSLNFMEVQSSPFEFVSALQLRGETTEMSPLDHAAEPPLSRQHFVRSYILFVS